MVAAAGTDPRQPAAAAAAADSASPRLHLLVRCIAALVCKRWEQLAASPELLKVVDVQLSRYLEPVDPWVVHWRLMSLGQWLCRPGRSAAIGRVTLEVTLGDPSAGNNPASENSALLAACMAALASGGRRRHLRLSVSWLGTHD